MLDQHRKGTASTQPRPPVPGHGGDHNSRRRDQAIADLIDAADVSWGFIELSVWDGRAILVRSRHKQKPGTPPRRLPSDEAVLGLDQTQRAARTLSELYHRPRAVFVIRVMAGKYSDLDINPPARPPD